MGSANLRSRDPGRLARVAVVALVVAAAGLTLSAPASTAPGEAARVGAPGFFGVDGLNSTSADFDEMVGADVGVYRAVFPYGLFKRHPTEHWDWNYADHIVEQTAENRIELVPILYGSPPWISKDLNATPLEGEARTGWNDLLIAFAGRYGPEGRFWRDNPDVRYQPLATYQIWNEPNSMTWWGPRPDPGEYATLLQRSAQAIHFVDPEARILTAGIVARPTNNHAIEGAPFLRELFSFQRAAESADALAYHPFAPTVRLVRRQLAEARGALGQTLAPDIPIWITEIGWGSKGQRKHPLIKSEEGQEQALQDTFRMILANRRQLGIERTLWYLWRERPDDLCQWCRSSGLVLRNSEPKPLLDTFRRFASR